MPLFDGSRRCTKKSPADSALSGVDFQNVLIPVIVVPLVRGRITAGDLQAGITRPPDWIQSQPIIHPEVLLRAQIPVVTDCHNYRVSVVQ